MENGLKRPVRGRHPSFEPPRRISKCAELKNWNENMNVLYIFAGIAPVV